MDDDTPNDHDPIEADREIPIPVAPMPPENLVEQAVERAATKVADAGVAVKHSHPVGMGLLIANVALVIALFFVRAGDRRVILHSTEVVKNGVACLLADLDDHRHTNQFAHENIAKAEGVDITHPDVTPLTKDQAQVLKKLCDEFVRAGTISLRHYGQGDRNEASP
jgi:hypothetical protein